MNANAMQDRAERARLDTLLWIAQRASAALLAGCVVIHLVTLVVAVRGGLSAAEILDRVAGNAGWLVFYLLFVLAAAVHAPIGVRSVLRETTSLSTPALDAIALVASLLILLSGAQAVFALYGAVP